MLLELSHITCEFSRNKIPFKAVDDVSITLCSGDFVSITGRSGSGKSTLLAVAAGLIRPASGSVMINGENILSHNEKALADYRCEHIGYVPQGQSLLLNFNVLDNVRLPYYLCRQAHKDSQEAIDLLKAVGISHLADAYPNELSGGEAKRVAIARALMNRPACLIADEPTSDLDKQTTREIMNLLGELARQNMAVLIATHESDTHDYGSSVYVMDDGRLNGSKRLQ